MSRGRHTVVDEEARLERVYLDACRAWLMSKPENDALHHAMVKAQGALHLYWLKTGPTP